MTWDKVKEIMEKMTTEELQELEDTVRAQSSNEWLVAECLRASDMQDIKNLHLKGF